MEMMLKTPVTADEANRERPQIGNDELLSVIQKGKNSLAQKLANAFIEKAATKIDNELTCKEHRNQAIVAFDPDDNSFGC